MDWKEIECGCGNRLYFSESSGIKMIRSSNGDYSAYIVCPFCGEKHRVQLPEVFAIWADDIRVIKI